MGRPINKRYFGPDIGKIKVLFHNGISVIEGYIVKQVSDYVFDLSQDGSTITRCYLAQTTQDATTLTTGKCSISITTELGVLYVRHLSSVIAITTEDLVFSWIEGLTTGSKGLLGLIQDAVPNANITLDFLDQEFISMGNEVAITDLLVQDDFFGTFDPTATTGGLQGDEPALTGDALNAVINGCSIVFHVECSSDAFLGFIASDVNSIQQVLFWSSTEPSNSGLETPDTTISVPLMNINALNKVAITVSETHIAISVNGATTQSLDYVGSLPYSLSGIFITGATGSYISAIEFYPIVSDTVLAQL